MISRERLAALIGEEIVKQNGADAVDNLGDWHSVHFLGSSPAINLARLAGIILDEVAPIVERELERAYFRNEESVKAHEAKRKRTAAGKVAGKRKRARR